MRPLTEAEVRDSFVNAEPDELRVMAMPHDFLLVDWDHVDFFAWRDPRTRGRGYLIVDRDGTPTGIVLRSPDSAPRAWSALCNLCHTMQPGHQVALYSARRAGKLGGGEDAVGTYICADLSCHENVRLAAPLAPNEIRARGQVDARIDGTRHRVESFVNRVIAP